MVTVSVNSGDPGDHKVMGNVMPCGGSSSRNSPAGRGGLLSTANRSGGHSTTSYQGNNGKLTDGCGTATTAANSLQHPSTVTPLSTWRPNSSHVGLRGTGSQHQVRVRRPQRIRALLGLPRNSHSIPAAKWALDRLGVEVAIVTTTTETTINSWSSANKDDNPIHLIVLDCRSSRHLDSEVVARSVRNSANGDQVVLVGIVKKSFMDREELVVDAYINAGFNRLLLDSGSRGYWLNELAVLMHSDVEALLRKQCVDLLLTALDSCHDVIQMTDSQDKVIYCNTAAERVLGHAASDLYDCNIWDYQATVGLSEMVLAEENDSSPTLKSSDLVRQKLDHGKIWDGSLRCRKRSGDYVVLETCIIPVSFTAKRTPDHIVYVRQPPVANQPDKLDSNSIVDGGGSNSSSRISSGSRKGIKLPPRHPSCDGQEASMIRRMSSSKMHALSVEAPITKVINIILSARENSPIYVAQALDKVVEILQTTGATDLFSPELDKERQKRLADPVTTDLLGALLSNSTRDALHQRRSSSEKAALTSSATTSLLATTAGGITLAVTASSVGNLASSSAGPNGKPPLPPISLDKEKTENNSHVQTFLQNCHEWTFDIIQLEKLTDHRCLSYLGLAILTRFQLHKTLGCSERTLHNWLTLIEANYKRANSYHNATHAADVLHASAFFLEQEKVKEMCDGVDETICLLAAVIHDVDHPGKNSAFLCNSNSELANLYNDITVLENHHVAMGFKLTMSDERVNIFRNLDRDSYKLIRQGIIDLVLATDMSKHFVHLNKFVNVFAKQVLSDADSDSNVDLSGNGGGDSSLHNVPCTSPIGVNDIPNSPENVAILKRMLIKCADVSNPARSLPICKEWAYRIAEEYFSQTDEEKRLGLPVVMPQFDRTTCSIPKSQLGFYDYFINDMFDVWNGFADLPQLSDLIRSNYVYWQIAANSEADKSRRRSSSIQDEEMKEEGE